MKQSLYNPRLQQHLRLIEQALPDYLPTGADDLSTAMRYACEAGGKRIRPVLTLEFCRLCGTEVERALPFACAVEMIHSYSLVHDDLPCMDDSPLRRGKPSVHAAFGEAAALLAGDALLTQAFQVMADAQVPAEFIAAAVSVLAGAAGGAGMVGGQMLDLDSEGKAISLDTLERLQQGKTAALLIAACELGCLAAGAGTAQRDAARRFGEGIGLSFQIVDDILDITSTNEALGKPTGSDQRNEKVTYVSLLGIEEARLWAARRTAEAEQALEPFGAEAGTLRRLSQALLLRES
ncbi:MAG: polyprenyl synthetase family protein [Clostridiales bacterium]|jgi:geranylgeranyl diphosphate synthase type II|nr:polyprenyl synthetase family protein [Clostridiales bacterium]